MISIWLVTPDQAADSLKTRPCFRDLLTQGHPGALSGPFDKRALHSGHVVLYARRLKKQR
jgi:hypothetical protein